MARPQAELGVFGGSGFYAFLEGVEEHEIETPYGAPSDKLAIGEVEGRRVAFLPAMAVATSTRLTRSPTGPTCGP